MHRLIEWFQSLRSKRTMRTPPHHGQPYQPPHPDEVHLLAETIVRRGELVDLRRHVPANRSAFVHWYQDREIAEVLRHDLEPLTEFQARAYFDTIVLPQSYRGTCWAVHLVENGALIGSTAVTDIDTRRRTCLFRIVIGDKRVWGKGAGTEATRLAVAEAFETLDLDVVKLEVFTHNERARGAYARVGFRETGRHVEWVAAHRREITVIEMSLERSSWSPTVSPPQR